MSGISKYKLLLILAAAVLLLDQATKLWIADNLRYGTFFPPECIQVIPGWFHIVHVGNTGAAWSMLSDHTWFLTTIGFVVLACIFIFRKALELETTKVQLAYGLAIGGIVGNLIDRVRLGHVIDFLDFQYQGHHFPSFNVADSGITVGVILYLYFSFFGQNPQGSASGVSDSPTDKTDRETFDSEGDEEK